MSSAYLAAVDRRQMAWCVVVFGLPYRFYSRVAPGTGVDDGTLYDHSSALVFTPTDVDAVLSVGPVSAQVDDIGGIVAHDPVEVTIRAFDARTAAGVRVQPYQTLMRVAGHSAAGFAARLATTLNHAVTRSGPTTVTLDRSAGSLTFPRAFHVGQEVIWANNWSDPGGGVYQLTGCTRAADGHVTQAHVVSDDPPEQPWITSDVVTWHGRRAAIYVSALDASGAAIGWGQYWSGFIDSAPELTGEVITLRIAPLTRVLGYKLGVGSAARAAKSVTGAHFFTTGVADQISAFFLWDHRGALFEATASAAGPPTTVTLSAAAAAMLDATGGALAAGWETTSLTIGRGGIEDDATAYTSPTLTFPNGSALQTAVAADIAASVRPSLRQSGTYVESLKLRLMDPATVEEVVSWPDRLTDVINVAQTWQPGPIDSWDDPTGQGGDDRLGRISLRRGAEWALAVRIKDLGATVHVPNFIGDLKVHISDRECYAGLIVEAVEDVRGVTVSRLGRSDGSAVLVGENIQNRDEYGQDRRTIAIPGAPEWFYQSGETYIGPFDRDLYTGAGATQMLMLTGPAVPVPVFVPIVSSQSKTHPDSGATIYFYTVAAGRRRQVPTVVQMQGDGPVEAVVLASINDTDPPDFLVRLLMSGIGNGDNGTYDTVAIGANLPTGLVREHTFTRMATPEPLRGQDYAVIRGKSIAEQMDGLLMACGVMVVSRYASPSWQLELMHTGPADVRLSALSITDADLIRRPGAGPVETVVDGRVVRSFTLKLNYAAFRGEPTEVPVELVSERNEGGADSGSPVVLDLPGVYVDGAGGLVQAAAEIVADMRARVGAPRVRWRFAIPADKPGALELGIGDVISLTSDYPIAIDPTDAVSSTPCRVVGLTRDLEANRLDLEVRPFGGVTSGYVPAMVVASVVDLDTVTVQASNLSDDDPGWFVAGDPVDCIPAGNWTGRTATTIASKAGTTINFAANHGLAVGDSIRMRDYDTVIAVRAAIGQFAYLADDTDTIGAGNAPGRVIG